MSDKIAWGETVYEIGNCTHPVPGLLRKSRNTFGVAQECFHDKKGTPVVREFSHDNGYLVKNRHGHVKRLVKDDIRRVKDSIRDDCRCKCHE